MLLGNREQKELTKYLGLNSVAFSEWKSGKSKSYRKYLIEIAEFFNVSIDYLVYGKGKNASMEHLSENEQEMLDVFSKFDPIEQAKLIGKLEGLYRYKQIKQNKQLEKSENSTAKSINKTENSNLQEAQIASRSKYNNILERTVVDDYSEVFDAPDVTDK